MGQTLSHGVYLPNEGERNCYAGLASNWQILNTAVGNIAEKAPLVHTHGNISNDGKVGTTANLPLITGTGGAIQAGAFGNAANTFCEGNDSRLSDARTPVAHTHGKADITDLFNSGTTWTAQNTYAVTGDVPIKITNNKDATNPSASEIKHIRFVDENAKIIGGLGNSLELGGTSKMYLYSRSFSSDGSSNSTHGLLIINNKQTGVHEVQSESNFIPSANNRYDLGSSSYQWNNLYAKKVNTQSVNGINPGALSLPDYDSAAKLNLTSTFPTPDSNGNIYYTPTMNGWLYICFNISSATTIVASDSIFYIQAKDNNVANANFVQTSWMLKSGGTNSLAIFFPVVANKQFVIQINFTGYTLTKVFLIPGLGHVA